MAWKYREELVGKRFLALRSTDLVHHSELSVSSSQPWLTGIIRASSDSDVRNKDLQVLVEFDGCDWQKRDWLKVYEGYGVFLVEKTLVLGQRSHPEKSNRKCWWPALIFTSLVDNFGIGKCDKQPVEFLVDQKLEFLTSDCITEYKEGSRGIEAESGEAARQWSEYQDGQGILVSTPTVLVGERVKVYRTEGTTQWFTAVIHHYNETTKELSLLDDTVLEEHYESAELTQIIPLDGVIESILKGSEARLTPRRARTHKDTSKDQAAKDASNSQIAQPNSGSNQPNTGNSKQQAQAQLSTGRSTNTENQTALTKQTSTKRSDSIKKDKAISNSNKLPSPSNRNTISNPITASSRGTSQSPTADQADVSSAHTSVIRRGPCKGERQQKTALKSPSSSTDCDKSSSTNSKDSSRVGKRRTNKRASSLDTQSVPTNHSTSNTGAIEHVTKQNSADRIEKDIDNTEMHIKKRRILGVSNTEEGNIPNTAVAGNQSSPVSVTTPASGTVSCPLPIIADNKTTIQKVDKLSDSSVDGCSSGYSSATTNDSTVSPRDKDGYKIFHSNYPVINSMHMPSVTPPTSSAHTSTSTAFASVSSTGQMHATPSPTAKQKSQELARASNPSSPLVVDTNKESPVIPYRDPELLKRDAESRKMQHSTPTSTSTSAAPLPTTRAMSTGPNLAAPLHQLLSASLMNPMQLQMQQAQAQMLQQMQLLEQYRALQQAQAYQNLNPLHLNLLQQPQLVQQQMLEFYNRSARSTLPTSAAAAPSTPWMVAAPFPDKQDLMAQILREQEMRAFDQKERADREKLEKERAEKKRQEEERERRQLQQRKERARILQESALQARDAVNEHFNESLKRLPPGSNAVSAAPTNNAATAAAAAAAANSTVFSKKNYRTGGEQGQPQDLSMTKPKDSRTAETRESQLNACSKSSSESRQKALGQSHELYMRSIQTGSSGQISSLVDEHFKKAALAHMPPKTEPMDRPIKTETRTEHAEFSLYGYQSQSFPNRFVSKDQLQQQLCKNETSNHSTLNTTKSSPKSRTISKTSPHDSKSTAHSTYSHQLIQEGLIPNPAYTSSMPSTVTAAAEISNNNSSISALVNMSKHAGSHLAAEKGTENLKKSEPSEPTSAHARFMPGPSTTSMAPDGSELQNSRPVLMKSFKSYVENAVTQAFYKDIEEQNRKNMSNSSPPAAGSLKSDKMNGVNDTDSDTLSAPSPTLSVKTESQDTKPCHPKMRLKKEWLQRHSDESGNINSSSPPPHAAAVHHNNSSNSNNSETTTSASETETDGQGSLAVKSKKRKSETSIAASSNGLNSKKPKNFEVSSSHSNNDYTTNTSCLPGSHHHQASSSSNGYSAGGYRVPSAGGGDYQQRKSDEQDSIKQLADIARRAENMQAVPYASKPLVKVSITTLKRTNLKFVQDGSCMEMAPKLTKCRECKMTPNQRNKKMPNIFCRFYAFRMLKFNRNGQICIAGFCDPSQAEADDITIWLPHKLPMKRRITAADVETAKYIISNVGDEFCKLVEQEQECVNWSGARDKLWKRAVQGVREMCDVCDTTLFNTHWVCHRCGFVVCIDCYRVKRKIPGNNSNNVEEEHRKWLSCTSNKNHEADKLMLTSIIPGDALKIAGDLIHFVRRKHGIRSNCVCLSASCENKSALNGPTPQADNGVKETNTVNGLPEQSLCMSYPQDCYRQSTFLTTSLDNKTLNTYSDDPLSLLADVAAMAPTNNSNHLLEQPAQVNGAVDEVVDGNGDKKPCLTLRKLLTKKQFNGSLSSDNKDGNITNSEVANGKSPAESPTTDTYMDEVDHGVHPYQHYQRRSGAYLAGRILPISACNLTETSLQYPEVRHSWLCDGKILRLLDAQHPDNFLLFNLRWKMGLPIIVSNTSKLMDVEGLWTPQAFSREFGHIEHDLIDCRRNEPLTGYEMKHFWDGFEETSRRLQDADGNPLILKLKDWPTAEDFAESMPSRFKDLMTALPMPQYTRRDGDLNLAGRLPEFFVKPDLGPKMYIAYGLAKYPQSGTTNLHLDVSDAVNVMVYVSHEEDLHDGIMKLIEESDCDDMMKRRVTEDGEIPGALWHIYDACDADKMRDLLNKVALEHGMELEPYHDPIHDQQFYLDHKLRKRLADEYGVYGYAILQCVGDAIFIPAGAPHQVQNLNGCIKVAEDFVSPEHLHHCFNLTQEFRHLSNTHTNHEDKLQVKNIIYHAIKDAIAVLEQSDPVS